MAINLFINQFMDNVFMMETLSINIISGCRVAINLFINQLMDNVFMMETLSKSINIISGCRDGD